MKIKRQLLTFLCLILFVGILSSNIEATEERRKKPEPHETLWDLERPVYDSIIRPSGIRTGDRGNMIWSHPLSTSQLRNLALRYGMTYSRDDAVAEFGRNRLFVLRTAKAILNEQDELRKEYKRFNTKVILYAFYYDKKAREKYPFLLDKDFTLSQLSLCREALEKCGDFVWGVFTGDEHISKVLKSVPKAKKEPTLWPNIKDIDNEVRAKYGFGKFGIPEGPKDRDPFKWSAFYRWVVDIMIARQKELYSLIREVAPHVRIISTNPSSHLWPFEFARQAPFVDIFTAQMQPLENARNITDGGCRAKLYVDLTGKQFWPAPHFNRTTLGYALSPEEVLRFSSILALSGATGLHIYTKNHYSKPPYLDMANFFFGAPERKSAVLTAAEFLNNFQVEAQTEPDFAIFYSNESNQARREELRIVHAYAFAGPVSGSWFRFVDETGLHSRKDWLSECKLLYVPYATYQSSSVASKLKSYARGGGILFLGDPLAFSFDLNGESSSNLREELTGCVLGKESRFPRGSLRRIVLTEDGFIPRELQGQRLPIQGRTWNVEPNRETRILARFDDGKPAICLNSFGKGKVIYSAFNLFPAYPERGSKNDRLDYRIVNHPGWKHFFRLFHRQLGIRIDRDIWRFRLPSSTENVSPQPGQFCLTNNYAEFRNEMAFFGRNKLVEGFYSYKKEPDLIPDQKRSLLPFNVGKLGDRRKAVQIGARTNPAEYIVRWANAGGAEIKFDFGSKIRFFGSRIVFSGRCPPIIFYAKDENSEFQRLGKKAANDVGGNVSEIWLVAHPPQLTSEVKIQFYDDRMPSQLTISEIEIWGDRS